MANVVEANILAATATGAPGQVMNIGNGRRTDLLELLAAISKAFGREVEPAFEAPRRGDVRDSLADIGRAEEILGYRPVVELEEGLARTVAWFRAVETEESRS